MTLTILDFILLIILFFFAFAGFFFGLIRSLGSLVGTVLGIIVAANYFQTFADWFVGLGMPGNWARIVGFLIVFIIVSRLISLIFWFLNKVYNVLSVIPFLKTINRISGLVFGLIEGGLIIGVVLVFVIRFPFADFLLPAIEKSQLAEYLFSVDTWLLPLLPELFDQAKDLINFI
ncbi:MAG: CvpA family protein [Patescibacteria group bacterium]